MTRTVIFLLALSLSTLIFGRAPLFGPEKVGKSDSGIYGPKYEVMKKTIRGYVARKHRGMASIVDLGKTENGVERIGILIMKRDRPIEKLVIITGATHGNEYLQIVDRLIPAFLNPQISEFNDFYVKGGAIMLVPVFNPYGYDTKKRYNYNGVDLNRDFTNYVEDIPRFNESETRNMAIWVDKFVKKTGADFSVSMDYHCCYEGTLLFPWAYTRDRPLQDRAKYEVIGKLMNKQFPGARYGSTGEILWYTADGTSKDYWYGKYNTIAMTYEGRHRTEKDLYTKHVAWWRDIIKTLL